MINFSSPEPLFTDSTSFDGALQENGINAELGLAASEDAILDSLSERAEKEIISGGSAEKNLIGHCAPFLSKLCRNFSLMQKVLFLLLTSHSLSMPSRSLNICLNGTWNLKKP